MMKKINLKIWAGVMAIILLASSCDDFLDINDNPNSATTSTPQLTLPAAIVGSASISSQYNSYGAHFGGYMANAGGFSGFGTLLSYNLTPSDYNGLWVNTYQGPLRDLDFVLDETQGDSTFMYLHSAAQIMTVYNYMKLVDTFGDIPYTQALQGDVGNLTPGYDDASEIYTNLIATLEEAIDAITATQASAAATPARVFPIALNAGSDPLFSTVTGSTAANLATELLEWKRFANTLKLKMLVRTNAPAASFNDPRFTTYGFISDDAIVDPGYETNRPNPAWSAWGRNVQGVLSNSSRVPTKFAFGFYATQYTNGSAAGVVPSLTAKIADAGRGQTIYVNFATSPTATSTPTNQLGNEVSNPPIIAGQVTWAGSGANAAVGVLKGPAMGQPLMLLAEARFLIAEALLDGKLTDGIDGYANYTDAFNKGILASFTYLYKDQNEAVVTNINTTGAAAGTADAMAEKVTYYQTVENPANRLVNINLAAGNEQAREAIITQKYIAVNMIHSDEGYNEYRRTGYPVTSRNGAPHLDIASNKSTITERADGLPTRVMYPSSEASFNAGNYRNVDYRSERIFWDPN